jgi:hypothetical protein
VLCLLSSAKLFNCHCCYCCCCYCCCYCVHTQHLTGSPLPKVTPPPAPVAAKLSWVPAEVIKCYAYKAAEMRVRVLQLVDDILLPARESDRVRAAGLCSIWHQLDELSKRGLRAMLDSRKQCQGESTVSAAATTCYSAAYYM